MAETMRRAISNIGRRIILPDGRRALVLNGKRCEGCCGCIIPDELCSFTASWGSYHYNETFTDGYNFQVLNVDLQVDLDFTMRLDEASAWWVYDFHNVIDTLVRQLQKQPVNGETINERPRVQLDYVSEPVPVTQTITRTYGAVTTTDTYRGSATARISIELAQDFDYVSPAGSVPWQANVILKPGCVAWIITQNVTVDFEGWHDWAADNADMANASLRVPLGSAMPDLDLQPLSIVESYQTGATAHEWSNRTVTLDGAAINFTGTRSDARHYRLYTGTVTCDGDGVEGPLTVTATGTVTDTLPDGELPGAWYSDGFDPPTAHTWLWQQCGQWVEPWWLQAFPAGCDWNYVKYRSERVCEDGETPASWSKAAVVGGAVSLPDGVTAGTWYRPGESSCYREVWVAKGDDPGLPTDTPDGDEVAFCCDRCYQLFRVGTSCGTWGTVESVPSVLKTSARPVGEPIGKWFGRNLGKDPDGQDNRCHLYYWGSARRFGAACDSVEVDTPTPPADAPDETLASFCSAYAIYRACGKPSGSYDPAQALGFITKHHYNLDKDRLGFNNGDRLIARTTEFPEVCVVVDYTTCYPAPVDAVDNEVRIVALADTGAAQCNGLISAVFAGGVVGSGCIMNAEGTRWRKWLQLGPDDVAPEVNGEWANVSPSWLKHSDDDNLRFDDWAVLQTDGVTPCPTPCGSTDTDGCNGNGNSDSGGTNFYDDTTLRKWRFTAHTATQEDGSLAFDTGWIPYTAGIGDGIVVATAANAAGASSGLIDMTAATVTVIFCPGDA